ncbi:MAG TPA: tetratricopeptide repeat protein [Bacillota bacterium]|nr:tetratricopeptide repeat protein [Bacillota bacterium]HOL08728.1 tetratricopeptide repeat protein [Bacillota bacterium]HPO96369.1 tetratricopeptide repeat protein [Bacillota bacterium]
MLKLAVSDKEQFNLAYSFYKKGNLLLAKNNLELAEEYYQKICALKRSGLPIDAEMYADVLHNLGTIAESQGETAKAIALYKQAIETNPKRKMTWLFIAKLYLECFTQDRSMRSFKAALEAIKEFEKYDPSYPALQYLKKKYNIA